jgi:CheY-like chemotaxis protein
VVDDERDARELLALVLSRAGARVMTADSASAALSLLDEQEADVIVSDVGMPDQDGYAFMQRVRLLGGRTATIPAVALTAYTRREDELQALARGFSRHLGKPVDPDDLVEAVASLARKTTSRPPSRVT